MALLRALKQSWRKWTVIITPLVLSPLVFPYSTTSLESKCAFMLITMAIYWITEALPLPVTSLLAIGLAPLLGIASSKALCKVFFADIVFLLLGGIFVALAVEECNLHKRFALKILLLIGVQPRRLLCGLMLTTWFLSMWISNTATTAMMMPITRALLAKLFSSVRKTKAGLEKGILQEKVKDEGSSKSHVRMPDPAEVYNQEYIVIQEEKLPELPGFEDFVITEDVIDPTDVELHDFSHKPTADNEEDDGILRKQQVKHAESRPTEPQSILEEETELVKKDANVKELKEKEEGDNPLMNLTPEMSRMLKFFSIAICYSANVGGIATLTGTVPNLVLVRVALEMSGYQIITFANWMSFGFIISLLSIFGIYFWLCIRIFGLKNTLLCKRLVSDEEVRQTRAVIETEYSKLGKMKFSEKIVLAHFLCLVALWLSRNPGSVPGWASLFKDNYATDGMIASLVGVSLFIFPKERPNVLFFRRKGDTSPARSMPSLLTWKITAAKFPWGTLFLLGGGFALAESTKLSGLSNTISDNLFFLKTVPVWAASILVTLITIVATEITSNTVICVLILPILGDIAIDMGVHPLYFMLPVTAAATMAFMLPVATPPNALVFAYGDVKVTEMISCGIVANLMGIGIIAIAVNTWGTAFFDLDTFPPWAAALRDVRANTTLTRFDDAITTAKVGVMYADNVNFTLLN